MTLPASSPKPKSRRPLLAIALLATIAAAIPIPLAHGQPAPSIGVLQYDHGVIVSAPSDASYSKQSDLRLSVDTRWINGFGYRPIRVRVVARQKAKGELRITIRLHIAGAGRPPLEVESSFDLPQGEQKAQAIVRVPQLHADDRCWWDVWVDGARDRELSVSESESWNISASGDSRSLGTSLNFVLVKKASRPNQLLSTTSEPIATTTFALADLPTDWLDYSAVDVAALTPRELTQLAATRPEALTALRRWIRSGGQLWIHSVGQNWEQLGDVERILEITNLKPLPLNIVAEEAKAVDERDRAVMERGWRSVPIGSGSGPLGVKVQHRLTGRVRTVGDPATIARLKLDPDYVVSDGTETAAAAAPVTDRDSLRWYLERPVGMGRVRAFRGGWDPVGFSMAWRMLGGGLPNQPPFDPVPSTPVTTAVETTADWQSRHGLTPSLANVDFADFLVPGVGLAPVTEFRVLITLFVLVIGPLNYWLLMRANRLHLLLLTVPILAVGLTAALFSYALVSDGLNTVVRVRSFTSLDQTTGESASWARLSYYAGLAPGAGLSFDEDVAVYPILSGWEQVGEHETQDGNELRLKDGRQLFTKGWLRSRAPTQYLTVRARKSSARLQLDRADDRLIATNQLGAKIRYLAVVDDTGNLFVGEAIDAGASAELQMSTHSDGLRMLREMMLQNQPVMPPELMATPVPAANQPGRRQRFFRQRTDPDFGIERLADNLMNSSIAALVASNAESVINMPRRSYVAITETGPEIDLGLTAVEEDASFHVLQGNW